MAKHHIAVRRGAIKEDHVISQTKAIQLLKHEKLQWRRERNGKGDFVNGVMFCLSLAVSMIQELGNYTQERMKDNPRYLSILYRRGK